MRSELLCLLFISFQAVHVSAWALHSSCTDDTATRVRNTMEVVFDVLDYASKRAQNTQYIQTDATLLQDLLGAPNEHDQATLNLAQSKVLKYPALI
jgi:hypothetical protein